MSHEVVLRVIEDQRARIRALEAELDAADRRMRDAVNAIRAGHGLPPLPEPPPPAPTTAADPEDPAGPPCS